MKNPFTPLIVEYFEDTYTLYGYIVLPPPNYLVGGYLMYI